MDGRFGSQPMEQRMRVGVRLGNGQVERATMGTSERTAMSTPTFRPRLNHVALSMAKDVLDDEGRAAILDFYGDVFGWTEGDNTGEDGNPLILYTGAPAEFIYLLPSDEPLTAPALDHFGLQIASLAELHEIVERAKRREQNEDRVRIVDVHARTTHGPTSEYTLTSAYIGFVLPLMIELQHIQRNE